MLIAVSCSEFILDNNLKPCPTLLFSTLEELRVWYAMETSARESCTVLATSVGQDCTGVNTSTLLVSEVGILEQEEYMHTQVIQATEPARENSSRGRSVASKTSSPYVIAALHCS